MSRVCCLICGQKQGSSFCAKDSSRYLHCARCSHVYVEDDIPQEELIELYARRTSHHASRDKEEWDYSAVKARLVYEPLLRQIAKFSGQGRLLDIGCSNGSFLHTARATGWEVFGIELEKSSWEIAKRHDLDVYNGELLDRAFPDNYFVAITMWQVIEHLADPRALLAEIHRILRPGGILAVSTPNIRSIGWYLLRENWGVIEPKVHLNLFTPRSLELLLRATGFKKALIEAIDIKPATVQQFLGNFRASKARQSPQSVAKMAQATSSSRMIFLLEARHWANVLLRPLGLGEDIYGYFIK